VKDRAKQSSSSWYQSSQVDHDARYGWCHRTNHSFVRRCVAGGDGIVLVDLFEGGMLVQASIFLGEHGIRGRLHRVDEWPPFVTVQVLSLSWYL
jgi:hypothetical protein